VMRPPGSLPAFKARYVARGFSQRQGVDYFQTFSPTPNRAFLHSSLHEEIWLRRPPSFTETTLAALGFAPSTAYMSLLLCTDTSLLPFYVLVYLDDVVFGTADTETPTLILQRFSFQFSLPQPTPLSTGHSLSAPPSDEFVEPSGPYPELVSCLITSGMGLMLGGRGPVVLTGHADASWVDDSTMQRSSQGYTFSLGSGSVSWRSTRSSSVLSSSCEAEIYAWAMAAQELRWLTYLLTDLGERPCSPPQHGQLRLAYVATRANTADVFTKALLPGDHQHFSTVLGLLDLLFLIGLLSHSCRVRVAQSRCRAHAVAAGAFLPGPRAAGRGEGAAGGGVGGGMGGAVRVGGVVRAFAGRQSAAGGDASVVSHARAIPPPGHAIVRLPRAGKAISSPRCPSRSAQVVAHNRADARMYAAYPSAFLSLPPPTSPPPPTLHPPSLPPFSPLLSVPSHSLPPPLPFPPSAFFAPLPSPSFPLSLSPFPLRLSCNACARTRRAVSGENHGGFRSAAGPACVVPYPPLYPILLHASLHNPSSHPCRPLVERITGFQIRSVLGLPAPRKDMYGVNVCGSLNPDIPLQPFTDLVPLVPPVLLENLFKGRTIAGPPISTGLVTSVFVVPIFRHPLPANASPQQIRDDMSIVWGGVFHLERRTSEILHMLENGSSTYYFAMYDNTEPDELKQIYGPEKPLLDSRSAFPFVLPAPVAPPDHVEPFPEDMVGRSHEAHCGFLVPPPAWDLVCAPMLLGLLVLLVAVLISTVISVLAWKRRNIEENMKEIQLCTAILERAERSKSEAVASTSHELRTPIIGMMGMIEELLDSGLEEWQRADLVDARACAGETVELINRVLDLAKLQAGRLQLETLPCCLRRIVRDAATSVKRSAHSVDLQVTVDVDENVPATLLGDPNRLSQVIFELVANAMSHTASGHVAIRLWCIPPQHSSQKDAPSSPPSAAAPTGATHASSESPPASAAWHQLASCVRRFPPPTRLVCHPQRPPVSKVGPLGKGGGQWWGRYWGESQERGGGGKVGAHGEPRGSDVEAKEVEGARQACEQACSRDSMGNAEERQDGGGHLEEVREWVEGACAVREEGEWMVVVACEDTGGGIPPEELRWVLDPHGELCHSMDDTDAGDGDLQGKGQPGIMERIPLFGKSEPYRSTGNASPRRQRERSTWDPLQRDGKAAAGPRWTPYPVRFLLSTSLVAEMRGGMAVLSHASTGTTILLVLPMGGGEDASSSTGVGEGSGEEVGESGGAGEEHVELESETQGGIEGPPSCAAAVPLSASTAQPAWPLQQQAAAAQPASPLVRASTFPQAEIEWAAGDDSVREAEAVVRGAVAGRRVAVVDDNAVNRMVARRTLQGYGAHVLLLCSGEEALQALSSATPSPPIHLLLLDLNMPPGIDGFETARRVRAMEDA
ncbi:unnamed protein product, partial [Closterium sp. NIES-53]